MSTQDIERLEYETVSRELKVHLTRLIEEAEVFQGDHWLYYANWVVNRSRALVGESVILLDPDDWGEYQPAYYEVHQGELELVFRRLDTASFVELLCDVVEREWLDLDEVNSLLEREGATFRLKLKGAKVVAEVFAIDELPDDDPLTAEHPNVRLLVERMARDFNAGDYPGVLHSSASIFETLAKDVVGPSVQNETLGGFFPGYVRRSQLPQELLDKVIAVYNERNTMPLAGHGSTNTPTVSREEAVALRELTKAFVRIEYTLQGSAVTPGTATGV